MLRDIFTHKWILGSCALLILIAGACYLWYQHTTAQYERQTAEAAEFARQLENQKAEVDNRGEQTAKAPSPTKTERKQAEGKNRDASTQPETANAEVGENLQTRKTETVKQDNTPQSNVAVSPYGFGPYPKIPDNWPKDIQFFPAANREEELILRVNIRLIEEGKNALGGSMSNGIVYPNIENVVYVEWSYDRYGDRYVSSVGGWPPAAERVDNIVLQRLDEEGGRSFSEEDVPSDITLMTYDEGGIDPYTYLGLNR